MLSRVSVSNWPSRGGRELDKVSAVGDPPYFVQIGRSHCVSVGERQRRAALQRGVAACRVVVRLELGKLPLKITTVPERHMVKEFPAHRADEALDEGVRERHIRHRFDFVDFQNPEVGHPSVCCEERIVIRTEMPRYPLPMD